MGNNQELSFLPWFSRPLPCDDPALGTLTEQIFTGHPLRAGCWGKEVHGTDKEHTLESGYLWSQESSRFQTVEEILVEAALHTSLGRVRLNPSPVLCQPKVI